MSTIIDMRNTVAEVVGSAFPILAPANTQAPYATYFRVSETSSDSLAEPAALRNTRVQIDVYASTYEESTRLSDKTRFALYELQGVHIQTTEMYEDEVQLYRTSLDFSFWFENQDDQ